MSSSVSSTPPASYLPGGYVTDLNRQALWNALSAAEQQSYNSQSSSSGGTSGSTGTTSTSTSKFVSQGSSSSLSATSLDGRVDTRSADPTTASLTGFGTLWEGNALLQAQLSLTSNAASKGGAIFVNVVAGTEADDGRPINGEVGDVAGTRGSNPFGYYEFNAGLNRNNFVRVYQGVETRFEDVNPSGTLTDREAWETTAKLFYNQFETTVSAQIAEVQNLFGSQGLLGFDVNNNGYIDNETELFGFDNGLDINGSATIKQGTFGSLQTNDTFTFLSAAGRLAGDPLDPASNSAYLDEYRRFQILKTDGSSVSLLQSDIGFTATTNTYVKAQAQFQLDAVGGAQIRVVAQQGFTVSASENPAISVTTSLPGIDELGRPEDGIAGNVSNIRGQNPFGYFDASGNFYKFVDPNNQAAGTTSFAPNDPGIAAATADYDGFESFIDTQRNTVLSYFGSNPTLGFDVDGSGSIGANEYFGSDLNLFGSTTLNTGNTFTFLTNGKLTGDPLDAAGDAGQLSNYQRFYLNDGAGNLRQLNYSLTQTYTAGDGVTTFNVTTRPRLDIGTNGDYRLNLITQVGSSVTAT